jgi:hypothetical protein
VDVVDKELSALKDSCTNLFGGVPVMAKAAFDFLHNSLNVEAFIREGITCAKRQVERNRLRHPFSPSSSQAVREAAMVVYMRLLNNEYTKVQFLLFASFALFLIVVLL